MTKNMRNAAGWFLLQLFLATLLSGCTFEHNIEEFRRKQRAESSDDGSFTVTLTFTSIAELDAWLSAQPQNTPDTPYTVTLNISDFGGDSSTAGSLGYMLTANTDKYVSLDLSGSTFASIGDYAFSGCTSLASVTIPDSVTSIGEDAFAGCSSLASVTIGNGVTGIGYEAFSYCSSLASVIIGNSVTSIGYYAFEGCSSLAAVTIPDSVTTVGGNAFDNCTSLASVTFEGTIASSGFDAYAFYGLGDLRDKFYATDANNGTPGTYTRASGGSVWTEE
jgi:hypothetical protein